MKLMDWNGNISCVVKMLYVYLNLFIYYLVQNPWALLICFSSIDAVRLKQYYETKWDGAVICDFFLFVNEPNRLYVGIEQTRTYSMNKTRFFCLLDVLFLKETWLPLQVNY